MSDIGQKVQTFHPGQRSTIYPCSLDPSNPLLPRTARSGRVRRCRCHPYRLGLSGRQRRAQCLTNTYYKGFAPRLGLNWSLGVRDGWLAKLTGGPSKTSVSMGYGIFYNPIEQLVLEQFSAEPPFGGSNFIRKPISSDALCGPDRRSFRQSVHRHPNSQARNAPRLVSILPVAFISDNFPPNCGLQYSGPIQFDDQTAAARKYSFPGGLRRLARTSAFRHL